MPPLVVRRSKWVVLRVGHPVGEHQRLLGVGPPRHRLQRLDAHRHATEGQRGVGLGGRGASPLGVDEDERAEVARLDGRQGGLQLLERRALLRPEGFDERAGVSQPRCIGHGGGL
jgi:hypothetical protein